MARRSEALVPRNGHTLVAGIVARISGGPNQKELSLDDQVDHGKEEVADRYDGPVEYEVISTTGKGERLDRPELAAVERLLRSRRLDVLVVEDIGRLVRGATAAWLCGIAVDHGVRVLAPNDCIDTADDTWEQDVLDACAEHVAHNVNASRRLKYKLMNRFKKFGGATAREVFGYIKPPGAKTYDDWTKDEEATPIYREWFRRLREDPNGGAVADWLNGLGVPVGKYARGTRWTGRMVLRVTRNPILKGMARRGNMRTRKHHETGRRVSVKNPAGPKYYLAPHLAHIDPAEFDEVNAIVAAANRGYGRKPVGGADPRAGVSRKRTVWPGQHARCATCGKLYYWGGHGQTTHMMCAGNREYTCWCGVTFDGVEGGRRIADAVLAAVEALPGYDPELERRVRAQAEARHADRGAAEGRLAAERGDVERAIANITAAIEARGHNDALWARLTDRQARLAAIDRELAALRSQADEVPELPPIDELKAGARAAVDRLAAADPEFGRLMRALVPEVLVFPFRVVGGGRVVARARVVIDLAGLLPDGLAEAAAGVLRTVVWVDLFDPPRHVALRDRIAELRASGKTEREAAAELGIQQPTVQRAMRLLRDMADRGLADPYEPLTAPPDDGTRLKRHRKSKYRFDSLPGFPAWPDRPAD